MTIEVLTTAEALDERRRLERDLGARLGTSDRVALRSRMLSGELAPDDVALLERLRSIDHLLHR